MKTNVTFSLSIENVRRFRIRKLNASKLVDDILKSYLDLLDEDDLKLQEQNKNENK